MTLDSRDVFDLGTPAELALPGTSHSPSFPQVPYFTAAIQIVTLHTAGKKIYYTRTVRYPTVGMIVRDYRTWRLQCRQIESHRRFGATGSGTF